MLRKNRTWVAAVLMIALAALACNLPGGAPPTETNEGITETPSSTPPPATATFTPAASNLACNPTVTATTLANVRSGPGQVYPVLGNLPQGGSAVVAGRNAESTWWYIEFAGGQNGFGWISNTVVSAECIPATLAIIAPPPAPVAPTEEPTEAASNPPAAAPSATPTSGFIIIIPPGGFPFFPSPTPTLFLFIPPGGFPITP